jgi:Uma2 family endonuclease
MVSATLVSTDEYLARTYRPDRELLDGQLVDRNAGEYDHSNLQGALVTRLRNHQRDWMIRVLPEQRIWVRPGRSRVPDVSVVSRSQEPEAVFTRPPLICIEILSKDDSLRSLQDRVDDYLNFGVPNVWVLDPATRRAYVCSRGRFQEPEGGVLEVPSTPIHIRLDDLFADLD